MNERTKFIEDFWTPRHWSVGELPERYGASRKTERPREALGQKPPTSVYVPGAREMPGELPDPEYPHDFIVRRVQESGVVAWAGSRGDVSTLLSGEAIGIEEIEDGGAQLRFGPIHLGLLK